jgi:hypothetical protein
MVSKAEPEIKKGATLAKSDLNNSEPSQEDPLKSDLH